MRDLWDLCAMNIEMMKIECTFKSIGKSKQDCFVQLSRLVQLSRSKTRHGLYNFSITDDTY